MFGARVRKRAPSWGFYNFDNGIAFYQINLLSFFKNFNIKDAGLFFLMFLIIFFITYIRYKDY